VSPSACINSVRVICFFVVLGLRFGFCEVFVLSLSYQSIKKGKEVGKMSWRRVLNSAQALAAHTFLLCFTLFLVLKLDHDLSCSWWLVFLPSLLNSLLPSQSLLQFWFAYFFLLLYYSYYWYYYYYYDYWYYHCCCCYDYCYDDYYYSFGDLGLGPHEMPCLLCFLIIITGLWFCLLMI